MATHESIQSSLEATLVRGSADSQVLDSFISILSRSTTQHFLLVLALTSAVLVGIMILATHRIAGPLFALDRRMKEVTQGIHHNEPLRFRRTDEFHELATSYNAMIEALRESERTGLKAIYNEIYQILSTLEKSEHATVEWHNLKEKFEQIRDKVEKKV